MTHFLVVFLGLVVMRYIFIFGGVAVLIPRVRACPACFDDTVAVRRRWLRLLAPWLEWRWCPSCGWRGPGRREPNELVPSVEDRRAGTSSPLPPRGSEHDPGL